MGKLGEEKFFDFLSIGIKKKRKKHYQRYYDLFYYQTNNGTTATMSSINSSRSSTKSHNSTEIWLDRVATMSQEEKKETEEDVQDYDNHSDMEGGGKEEEGEQNDVDDANDIDVEARNNHTKMISTDDARTTSMSRTVDDNNNNDNKNNASFGSLYRVAADVCQEMKEEEEKKKNDKYHHPNDHKIKHNRTTSTATSSIDAMGEEEEEEENDGNDIDDLVVEARNKFNHTKNKIINYGKSMIYDHKKNGNAPLISSSKYAYDDDDDDEFVDACTDMHVAECTQGDECSIELKSNSCDSDLECSMVFEHQRVIERKINGWKARWAGSSEEIDVQFRQSMIDRQMKSFKEKSTFDMPEDVYAFIITSKITSPSFMFACYVIGIKYIVYGALLAGIHVNEFSGAEKTATAVKFFLIPVAIAMQDDLMAVYSGISNTKYDKSALEYSPYATYWKFNLSYLLRLADGLLSLSVNFGVMLATDDVLGVFLNFAALHFLQDIDNVFYVLVEKGFFGDSMEHMSTVCKQIQWPRRRGSNKVSVILTELDTIFFVCTLVVCLILYFYVEFELKYRDNEYFGGNTSYTNSSNTTTYISMVEWWNVCCKPITDSN